MAVHISLFRRTILATTFLVVPATALFTQSAMAQCAASAGTVSIPANGSTVTCYTGLTSTTQVGNGTTSATVSLEDNHFLDLSAGGYGVHLNSTTVTLGIGARIDGATAGNGMAIYTTGVSNATLGTGAQLNGNYAGIYSGSGNSTISLGSNSYINSNGMGIRQNGNPIITLGAGAQINAGGTGIDNNFGGTATITLGTNAQINAGTFGVRSKYSDLTLQSGAQINAGNAGVILAYGSTDSTITLASGSSIISATAEAIRGNNGTGHDVVDNAGLLQGVGNAVNLRAGDDTLILRTGSQIIGNVGAGTGTDTLNLFGTGVEDADFLAFEIFNMNGTDWTLSGSSVLGTTSLNTGILRNNGAMAANVTVNAGATLGGTGNTTGDVSNNGTIAPGNGGIGTHTVTGNFVQGAGGMFSAEITPATSDLLNITGTATLDGNLNISQSGAGTIADGTIYTVLQAGGGVAGTFSSVTDNLFFVNFTPTINPGNVQITANRSLAAAGITSTEQNLAQVLDQAITAGGLGTAAIDALLNTIASPQQASNVLASQSGLVTSAATNAARNAMGQLAQDVLARAASSSTQSGSVSKPAYQEYPDETVMDYPTLTSDSFAALNSIAPAAGGLDEQDRDTQGPTHVWMQGTGGFGSVAGDTTARGNDYYGGGMAIGVEYDTGNDSRFGTYASAAQTISKVDGLSDEATTGTYAIGLYGSWQPSTRWDFQGLLSAGWLDNETVRPTLGGVASADFSGYGAYGYLESSFKSFKSENSFFAPLLGVESSVFGNEAYRETGAGAFNLAVDSATSAQMKALLGAKLFTSGLVAGHGGMGPLNVSAQFKTLWSHEFLDPHPEIAASFSGAPSTAFTNPGPDVDRDAFRISGGFAASPLNKDYMEFYTSYHLNLSQDASDNRISGGFRLRW